ncbi:MULTISPECIES: ImmA/IrrE family metallo-endopeptidase [Microcystis]|uniref:Helix-turn-helix family protein n=2 Tax=Microcystis TaxID=1125 RepID=L7EAC4_MICAE|nr:MULTISPECIES: ImmA/IrrE family metallo-endopeptidase [Microcystis]ELP56410.1 helix-turn-helix family protein [Microcystis aeruginosa TAIHU98]MBD2602359.1 ImmA/IrrE family metallo-endopeptidase [Microcystis viridis FACHB-1342]MDB9386179.1 ImmA/IrrE family metallo-endopeptidase [Microcystis aeruginosa CS-583]ODV38452.1 Zn peptidase with DNA binding [Microcystis aeruginosa NIES-98]
MGEKLTGVNPKIIQWARERARYSLESVAVKFKKDVSVIEKWESGEDFPTYSQLEKLAEIYKRPLALFFFPEPPLEAEEKQEFRTLPDFEIENLAADTIYALRQAKAMQLSLQEINNGINPSTKKIFQDIAVSSSDDLRILAEQIRNYLNVTLEEQLTWNDQETALKKWRSAVEEAGIFIFKRSFKQREISGFCLIDIEFPIIYINNSTEKSRQIFTIFHELAHILLQTNGITKSDDRYINSLQGENKYIEIFCNKFAAEFLLPNHVFSEIIRETVVNVNDNDKIISKISSDYKVSREVVLRKLLDNNFISQKEYSLKVSEWYSEQVGKSQDKNKKSGGNPYANQATYLGENYLKLVFNKYYQGQYDIERVADYLNIKKVATVEKLEQYLLDKGLF